MGRRKGEISDAERKARSERRRIHDGDQETADMLKFNLLLYNMPPIDHSDPAQLKDRIQTYFDLCVEYERRPGAAGLATAIGVTRQALLNWRNGATRPSSEHQQIMEKAFSVIDSMMEQFMLTGKVNPVSGIFLMANNHGYRQKVEVTAQVERPQLETLSRAELEQRYNPNIIDAEIVKPAELTHSEKDPEPAGTEDDDLI